MNRRIFLGSLTVIPFIGIVKPSVAMPVAQPKDHFLVMTPEEITKYWDYVETPIVNICGGKYHCKTWRLKSGSNTQLKDHPITTPEQTQRLVKEIIRHGLTHVRRIYYSEYPIVYPDWSYYWPVMVQGFNIRDERWRNHIAKG